jgi:hypothetical protein
MASQIERERVLANFKPTKAVREKAKRTKKSAAQRRPGMSEDHLADIRKMPCCGCLSGKHVHAHHLLSTKDRGMGQRSTDKDAVPLCFNCHEALHRKGSKHELTVFQGWGIADPLQLAADFWRSRGDLVKMRHILLAHKVVGK